MESLRLAGISVFSVAVSTRAHEIDVRGTSSIPQLANINYFISPSISDLNSISSPLAKQVFYLTVQAIFSNNYLTVYHV